MRSGRGGRYGKVISISGKNFCEFINSNAVSECPAILVLLGSHGLFLFLQETCNFFFKIFSFHGLINMYPEMETRGDTLILLYRYFAALA